MSAQGAPPELCCTDPCSSIHGSTSVTCAAQWAKHSVPSSPTTGLVSVRVQPLSKCDLYECTCNQPVMPTKLASCYKLYSVWV
jgi:hypothetical protein